MKQLRILTGRHAGARIRLTHRHCTLGAGDDTDVQISDWKQQTVTLTLDEGSNVIRIALAGGTGGAAMRETQLEDFVPRCFGDIVVCAGPASDKPWPTDLQLLKRLLREQKAARRPGPARLPSLRLLSAGGAAGALLLGGFIALVLHQTRLAEAREHQVPLPQRVAAALAQAGLAGLTVSGQDGSQVIVSGLVPGQAELARVRALTLGFGDADVVARVGTAADVGRAISDALASNSLQVAYQGDGIFVVSGEAPDVDLLRTQVTRIAQDIGPAVRRIDVVAHAAPAAERAHLDAMLVAPDLQYVQTRDGTKHLVVASPAGASAATLE